MEKTTINCRMNSCAISVARNMNTNSNPDLGMDGGSSHIRSIRSVHQSSRNCPGVNLDLSRIFPERDFTKYVNLGDRERVKPASWRRGMHDTNGKAWNTCRSNSLYAMRSRRECADSISEGYQKDKEQP